MSVWQGKRRRTANSRFDSYVRLPERDQHWPRAEGPLGDAPADDKDQIQAPGGAAWQPQQQFRPPDAYRLDGEDSGDSYDEDTDSDELPMLQQPKGGQPSLPGRPEQSKQVSHSMHEGHVSFMVFPSVLSTAPLHGICIGLRHRRFRLHATAYPILCIITVPLRRGPGLGTAVPGTPLLPGGAPAGSVLGLGPVPRKRRTHGPGKEESGSAPPSVLQPAAAADAPPPQTAGETPQVLQVSGTEARVESVLCHACQPAVHVCVGPGGQLD